jgi:Flagellar protein FlbT
MSRRHDIRRTEQSGGRREIPAHRPLAVPDSTAGLNTRSLKITENPMQQVENTRKIDSLVQRALAGGGVTAKPSRAGGTQCRTARPVGSKRPQNNPCEVLQRLAQVIQLMRLDHADAHLYRDGCDVLVQDAVEASKWSGLPPALAQIMSLVGQGDYHCALMELRAISQPEWHTC